MSYSDRPRIYRQPRHHLTVDVDVMLVDALDDICVQLAISRAQAIRDALALFVEHSVRISTREPHESQPLHELQ